MCKGLTRLLLSCQILFLVIPDVPTINPDTPGFVAIRRKMLDLVLNDRCNKLNHISREFKKVHPLHGFVDPRKFLRSLPQKKKWFAAKSVGNQACNETLLLFTQLPDEEKTACNGAFQPMCRYYKEKGWICSVLWSDELQPFPPKQHDFKYCAGKSLEVDEAYRKKLEPEVGAGSSPGHQRWYSPGRDSKNSDMSSRNSKRNRNAEATNENTATDQESSRGSDDEGKPPTKSYSLIIQYSDDSDDSDNSRRSKSSSGRDSQMSSSSNDRDSQRSKGRRREYIEAVTRTPTPANTVLLKPGIENGGGAHGMKSKAEMAKDWVASRGKKFWDTGRENVLKTGKAWKESGGGAHGMKSKAEMAKDWVVSRGKKFWDTGSETVLKTGKAWIESGGGAHGMKSKAEMIKDWVASLGIKFREDISKTGNRHPYDVKSPDRDSSRVRNTGRANSPSSPSHASNGISLNVKLNKYHPGDVSFEP